MKPWHFVELRVCLYVHQTFIFTAPKSMLVIGLTKQTNYGIWTNSITWDSSNYELTDFSTLNQKINRYFDIQQHWKFDVICDYFFFSCLGNECKDKLRKEQNIYVIYEFRSHKPRKLVQISFQDIFQTVINSHVFLKIKFPRIWNAMAEKRPRQKRHMEISNEIGNSLHTEINFVVSLFP